jgi:hypothetical protein
MKENDFDELHKIKINVKIKKVKLAIKFPCSLAFQLKNCIQICLSRKKHYINKKNISFG